MNTPPRDIPAQLTLVGDALTHLQAQVQDIRAKYEEYQRDMQQRIASLEREKSDLSKTARDLARHNQMLSDDLSNRTREMAVHEAARKAASQKLRNERRVFRDVLNECLPNSPLDKELVVQELYTTLFEGSVPAVGESSRSGAMNSSVEGNNPPVEPMSPVSPHSGSFATALEQPGSDSSRRAASSVQPASTPAVSNEPVAAGRNAPEWRIHYSGKVPSCAGIKAVPFPWTTLRSRLDLDEEVSESIESLALAPSDSLRLQIFEGSAFVYDPCFLDELATRGTRLLDWGPSDVNEEIAREILEGEHHGRAFHTFVFPKVKNQWYYVGALTWTVEEGVDIWRKLGRKSRERVVRKLAGRSGRPEADIHQMLDENQLTQLTVRISSENLVELSYQFLHELTREMDVTS